MKKTRVGKPTRVTNASRRFSKPMIETLHASKILGVRSGDAHRYTGEIPVRAVPVRSERLRHAVSSAYAEKYATKASRKWVHGLAEPSREINTLELVPA